MPNAAYLFVAGEPVKAGGVEAFVLQFPGTPQQAQAYVDQNGIGGMKFVLDAKPLNEKNPLIICQKFKPAKKIAPPANLKEDEEELLVSDGDGGDNMFEDPVDELIEE